MTTPEYAYGSNWLTTSNRFFPFQLKACRQAHVMLASIPGNDTHRIYEVRGKR